MKTKYIYDTVGEPNVRKTILYSLHVSMGAQIMEFGGFDMPIQYGGILMEHEAARKRAAVFDTCHMGEFRVRGEGATADLERVLSCDVADLQIGACRYGFICNDAGGVIDDQIIYRMAENEFMMVVNAATGSGDYEWIKSHISDKTTFDNISKRTAKIDIQGPASPSIVASVFRESIGELKYYRFMRNFYKRYDVIVSRTGYTGEIGFEIYCPVETARDIWSDLLKGGAIPAGLGARDLLRLEMGYPLYGHELSAERNAAESGLTRAISRNKEFIGSEHVLDVSAVSRILCGVGIEGRRTARTGNAVLNGDGEKIGTITSGCYSPTLGHAVALAYIDKEHAEIGADLRIAIERGELYGKVVELPFYKNGTARADIKLYL